MECVILAAGEGKRMRPLTTSRPKVMLPVANRPMLEHLVLAVRDAGVSDFVFVVGYHEQEIRNHFKDGSFLGVNIRYTTQRRQMGTADALLAAQGLVTGRFLLLNGDMILKTDDIKIFCKNPAPCVGTFESSHPEDFGVVISEGTTVSGIYEKSKNPPGNIINAGIYLFDLEIFDILKNISISERGEYELTDALSEYISSQRLTSCIISSWCDIGEPWNLVDANESLMKSIRDDISGIIENGVCISGNLVLGKGSVIKSGTYIEGNCIIGENCDIGPHAYIRGCTSVGDNCHIGHSVEVKNSVIFRGTKIPHFNYVGDSVIGSGCNFGAGTKIANLRHDRKNVRVAGTDTKRRKFGAVVGDNVQLGINCSVNTGTVIGSGVTASPGSCIEGVISDNSKIVR
ncbi:bifunctional UDP-N-acetylglucosamine pyrophosphorylase/glucosamine-1-phosphate N-acetyltransferase [Methanomicrobium sp. W14]|uniref:bifunctional sugar-1-phosphate nucleotidylyltransferase/acetyltransferase n=1 Tax=Methanomicrobium sp. W14 TaxID=2817839 RepID=UPI001AEB75CB|nr:bifunctional sugar-1-phosphate nucleotidylyltransferase/acetyltransferase [Methanomicrobium sp. W14]MBP2133863.1 bifunctional UDP-N-acetylglucosamine pyrophosphorylase/glucosamine-1-phosphate N-acetyltransferase [Methanomicrobium sp. W14]